MAAVVFITPLIATPAMTKPSSIDPESPMKTRAGWKLKTRKAAQAPARAAAMIAGSARPREAARMAKVVAPRPVMPAARPSIPSMKLIMFTRATNQSTVSGYWAGPRSPTPRNGSVMWSIVRPAATGTAAHATWPASFSAGRGPRCRRPPRGPR